MRTRSLVVQGDQTTSGEVVINTLNRSQIGSSCESLPTRPRIDLRTKGLIFGSGTGGDQRLSPVGWRRLN